jgi:hypothetical protein
VGRKRIGVLYEEHRHLLGLGVRDSKVEDWGPVIEVRIERHRPVITVDFPRAGEVKLVVVGSRVPKALPYDFIQLRPGVTVVHSHHAASKQFPAGVARQRSSI